MIGRIVYGIAIGVTAGFGCWFGMSAIRASGLTDDVVSKWDVTALLLTFFLVGYLNGVNLLSAYLDLEIAKKKYEQETRHKWREK